MKYKHLFILILFVTTLVNAQSNTLYTSVNGGKGCRVSVLDLLHASYAHYPSIMASQKMLLGAQAQKEGAIWNYFPTPSIDMSQRAGRRGTTLRLEQPLWTGGKLDAMTDMAYARDDEARFTLAETGYVLSEKVLNVLRNLIQSKGEITAFSDGQKELQNMAIMLNKRVSAGVSSESDRELLNARLSQINADLTMAKVKHDMARSQLKLLTGRSLECEVELISDPMLKQSENLEEMMDTLVQTHPTLSKMEAHIALAQAEKKSADAAVMPNVSLRAEHQRGSVYDNVTVDNQNLAYVAVSFNPGAGLSAFSNMESAKYTMMQAIDEKKTKEQELKETLLIYYSDYRSSSSQIKSMQKTIVSSKKVLASYGRLFIAGKRQWLDLVNASRELTQREVELANLKATFIVSAYRLALQMGKINFENRGAKCSTQL